MNKALDYLDISMDYAAEAATYDEKKMSDTDAKYIEIPAGNGKVGH